MIGERVFDAQMEEARTQIQALNNDSRNKNFKEPKKSVDVEVQTQPIFELPKQYEMFNQWPMCYQPQQLYWTFPNFN